VEKAHRLVSSAQELQQHIYFCL